MRILKDLSLFTAQTATLKYIRKDSSMYDQLEPFPASVILKSTVSIKLPYFFSVSVPGTVLTLKE